MMVSGMVMTQYNRNWGSGRTPISFDEGSTLLQSNIDVENKAETKLPGRKNIVTMASVFIESESRC